MASGGVDFPPVRSLQDFLTNAEFTTPSLNDTERMSNRVINNLIYYQTNYFLCVIIIFLIVGTLYPKDLIIGAVSLATAVVLYAKILKKRDMMKKHGQASANLAPIGVGAIVVLLLYMMGSVLVFLWGVTMPLVVVLLHSICRKRNLKNKFANVSEMFKERPTPMSIMLATIQDEEDPRDIYRISRN
ncbi:predicted protein [Nematostella vectensis]|uniref:PRA1 family protein n=1 Tax=Nematostella vectensis TaxID=45351 RepID=A7S3E1_NEMVE|nr:PRA1 family protein 3 [Nematostella vectensis]EDO41757.1 predicted protein [Nematostella vectensis]|eukprot:XP_001633820.1 predicted protein [Nematostella vectensis]